MAKLFAVVFTDKDGRTLFLLDAKDAVISSDYSHLAERIGETVKHLKWLIDGSPVTYRSFFGQHTRTTPIEKSLVELYQQMINTVRIEPIHNMILGSNKTHFIDMRAESKEDL